MKIVKILTKGHAAAIDFIAFHDEPSPRGGQTRNERRFP
jgi:hypothetical protein